MSTFLGGSGHSGYETAMGNLTGGIVSTVVVQVSRSNQPTLSFTGRGCTLVVLAKEL
jgi:hypothetical protein